jgi:hypothetical protein
MDVKAIEGVAQTATELFKSSHVSHESTRHVDPAQNPPSDIASGAAKSSLRVIQGISFEFALTGGPDKLKRPSKRRKATLENVKKVRGRVKPAGRRS